MVTINLLSDCASRDSCNLLEKSGEIRVMQYPGFFSACSLLSEKTDIRADINLLADFNNNFFWKRGFVLDFNKESFDYLFAKKSDYIIVSFTNNRLELLKRGNHILSFNGGAKEFIQDKTVNEALNLNLYEKVSPYDISEKEWKYNTEKICDIILSRYTVDQIIYHRHFAVKEYETSDGCLKKILTLNGEVDKINKIFQIADGVALDKLKGCHVVDFPDAVTSYEKHWFGLYYLHYVNKYYQYTSEAIKIILNRLPRCEEAARLERLLQEYNEWFGMRHEYLALNTKNHQMELRLTPSAVKVMPGYKPKDSLEEELRATQAIRVYLDILKQISSRYLIVCAVRDTTGDRLPSDILDQLHDLGFKALDKQLWKMYIGVSVLSEIVCDKAGDKPEEPVAFDYDNDKLSLSVVSKSWRKGNIASIKINGQECAVNIRGINIVVYDLESKTTIDSVALDAHSDYWTFKRKKCE